MRLWTTGKDLNDCATPLMEAPFCYIALNLPCDDKFKTGKLITEVVESHQQFWNLGPAGTQNQLRWRVCFQNENTAGFQTLDHCGVDLAA